MAVISSCPQYVGAALVRHTERVTTLCASQRCGRIQALHECSEIWHPARLGIARVLNANLGCGSTLLSVIILSIWYDMVQCHIAIWKNYPQAVQHAHISKQNHNKLIVYQLCDLYWDLNGDILQEIISISMDGQILRDSVKCCPREPDALYDSISPGGVMGPKSKGTKNHFTNQLFPFHVSATGQHIFKTYRGRQFSGLRKGIHHHSLGL